MTSRQKFTKVVTFLTFWCNLITLRELRTVDFTLQVQSKGSTTDSVKSLMPSLFRRINFSYQLNLNKNLIK